MSNRHSARHRATPTSPLKAVSKAVSSHAGAIGRPAAVVIAASGLLLSSGLPANASGESRYEVASSTHTVQPGDTLGKIASNYGISLNTIFALNGMGMNSVIYPGTQINVSGSVSSSTPAPRQSAPAQSWSAPAETSTQGVSSQSVSFQRTGGSSSSNAPTGGWSWGGGSTGGSVSYSGIAGTAQSKVGTPYVFGGTSTRGWDCSGFVKWVYAQHGINLPRTSWAQIGSMRPTSNPKPGDLVSQNGGGHVGIYIGGGKMVSALNPGQGTKVHSVHAMQLDGYYTR